MYVCMYLCIYVCMYACVFLLNGDIHMSPHEFASRKRHNETVTNPN
jgi:hypothetical protein